MNNKGMSLFVTGIGTDVGKTVVSAILCSALDYDYWKPIQAGNLKNSDSAFIRKFCGTGTNIHPEAYAFKQALSPHAAAARDKKNIELSLIKKPKNRKNLIIEGAGGVCVPLNARQTTLDMMIKLKSPVILVVRNYLGSINHTLLSIHMLKCKGLTIAGIIISGKRVKNSEDAYQNIGQVPILTHIPTIRTFNKTNLQQIALSQRSILRLKLRAWL